MTLYYVVLYYSLLTAVQKCIFSDCLTSPHQSFCITGN